MYVHDIFLFFVGLTDEGTVYKRFAIDHHGCHTFAGASFAKRLARSMNSHLLIFSDVFKGIGEIPSATMIDEVEGET